jgi:hypothetical protein
VTASAITLPWTSPVPNSLKFPSSKTVSILSLSVPVPPFFVKDPAAYQPPFAKK